MNRTLRRDRAAERYLRGAQGRPDCSIMRSPSIVACFVLGALLAALLFCLPAGTRAQAPEGPDSTSSTTEDCTGLVTAVDPRLSITVKSRRGPFTYRLGLDLHITGPDNHPLEIFQVHPGDEATVFYYYRDGWPTVARIVVLKTGRPARK